MSQAIDTQVLYQGRWVSKEYFRAFVYNSTGQKLAKSYQEFSDLISSGAWFVNKSDIPNILTEAANTEESPNVVQIKRKGNKKCRSQQSQ